MCLSESSVPRGYSSFTVFFFNDTATTEIYTLSLHDALPISRGDDIRQRAGAAAPAAGGLRRRAHRARLRLVDGGPAGLSLGRPDRKSTRLNSSHANISYAVFCLKKKNK